MVWVRSDNEHLMQEQERILKSLSDKQNQGVLQPSPDRDMQEENKWQTKDQTNDRGEISHSQQSNKNRNYNEAESGNVLEQQEIKKQIGELLSMNLIEPSISQYSCLVFLVWNHS